MNILRAKDKILDGAEDSGWEKKNSAKNGLY